MDKARIIEIAKKNIFGISCGVVALLALIAWFWPVGSMYGKFQDDLKARLAVAAKIKALNHSRTVPPVGAGAQPEPLTHFPNPSTIEVVKGATTLLKKNAEDTLAYLVDVNRAGRELLEPGSLPAPLDNNQSYHFRLQYNAVMDYGGKPEPYRLKPEDGPFNLPDQILNATKPATSQEVADAKQKKYDTDYAPRVYVFNGQKVGEAAAQAEFDKDQINFAKDFHQARASQFKIYCDTDNLTRAPHLTPTETPIATDIWFAQMTLWIEQDICQTIREMNKNVKIEKGQGIQMSPVKNLLDVTINPDIRMYVMGQAVPLGPGSTPPVELEPTAKMPWISPTGRVCNTLYDAVTFHFTVVVLPSHLQEFLEKLRYERMLTVTSMAVQDVDWKAAEDQGLIYGPARCVKVSLDCEELFMRDWTVRQVVADPNHPAPMPIDVQKMLGITPQTPTPAPTPNKVAMQ